MLIISQGLANSTTKESSQLVLYDTVDNEYCIYIFQTFRVDKLKDFIIWILSANIC